MGAGHLNANRALTQFAAGEHEPSETGTVPLIGWDYSTSASPNTQTRYRLDTSLAVGEHVQVTMAWDRIVEFDNNPGNDDVFQVNDTFEEYTDIEEVLSDLDIFLVERDGDIFSDPILAGSNSTGFSVEHFLFEIDTAGLYDLVIDHSINPLFGSLGAQNYGLAWWAGGDSTALEGDFSDDGVVGQTDLDLVLLNWGDTVPPDLVPAGWVNDQPGGPSGNLIGQTFMNKVLLNWGNGASSITAVPRAKLLGSVGVRFAP